MAVTSVLSPFFTIDRKIRATAINGDFKTSKLAIKA